MLTQGCTTHKAACGIETSNCDINPTISCIAAPHTKPRAALKLHIIAKNIDDNNAAPHTKPRAALKLRENGQSHTRTLLHHTQSRVRH